MNVLFDNRRKGLYESLRKIKGRSPFQYHPHGLRLPSIEDINIVKYFNVICNKSDRVDEGLSDLFP